jgi:PAS domain S-box-containing protein
LSRRPQRSFFNTASAILIAALEDGWQASPDDITITDLEGRILMVSPAAKTIYGYDLGSVEHLGKYILDFIIPEDRECAKTNISLMHQGGNLSPSQHMSFRQDQSRR